ncbi:MAG TPA: hypothetical protein VFT98_06490 [Myxococcota bacterium]|nr:hypothetical protein [Myxococcota bacterium]
MDRCSITRAARAADSLAEAARALAIVALLAAPGAKGAEETRAAALPPSDVSWRDGLRFQLGVEGMPDVAFRDAGVSWLRATGQLSLQGPVSERWAAGVSLSADWLSPRADAEASFLPQTAGGGEALRDLLESNLRIGARRTIREHWTAGAELYLTAKLEPGAELGRSLKGGSVLAVGYQPSDALLFAAGAKIGSRFDHAGAYAWPVLRVQWQATDRLELELHNANLRLAYELRDHIELLGFGAVRADRYRLELREVGALAARPGTIGIRDATVGVGLRWTANEHVRVIAMLGAVVWQRLLVNDADADRIESRTAHGAAPSASLRLQARF